MLVCTILNGQNSFEQTVPVRDRKDLPDEILNQWVAT